MAATAADVLFSSSASSASVSLPAEYKIARNDFIFTAHLKPTEEEEEGVKYFK